MKYCVKCQTNKPLNDYYQYTKKDRPNIQVFSYCKECTNAAKRSKKIKHKNTCEYCLEEFESVRFDARFCCTYHSFMFRKDPERKVLKKVDYKSKENTKIILDTSNTVKELCKMFNINKMTVYNIRMRNGISTKKIGRKLKVKVLKVEKIAISKQDKIDKYNKILKGVWNEIRS